jgi:hypothetical protein
LHRALEAASAAGGLPMKSRWQFRLGLILVGVSIVFFLTLIALPFLHLSGSLKLAISPVVFIVAEVLFWGGSLLAGKEVIAKYWQRINPVNWFKKKKPSKAGK